MRGLGLGLGRGAEIGERRALVGGWWMDGDDDDNGCALSVVPGYFQRQMGGTDLLEISMTSANIAKSADPSIHLISVNN